VTSQMGPEWQRLYIQALVETNLPMLVERVSVAEKAILLRVAERCTNSDDRVEWKAVEGAITGMSVLREEILKSRNETTAQRTPAIAMPRTSAS